MKKTFIDSLIRLSPIFYIVIFFCGLIFGLYYITNKKETNISEKSIDKVSNTDTIIEHIISDRLPQKKLSFPMKICDVEKGIPAWIPYVIVTTTGIIYVNKTQSCSREKTNYYNISILKDSNDIIVDLSEDNDSTYSTFKYDPLLDSIFYKATKIIYKK